jgi:ankyrin repeat protein
MCWLSLLGVAAAVWIVSCVGLGDRDDDVETLRDAAERGDVALVVRILDAGVPADACQKPGWSLTPLTFAARKGHADVAELLLSRGADVNATAPGAGTPLAVAAEAGRLEMVRLLLEHGANANLGGPDGFSPLMCVARCGDVRIAFRLVNAGAVVNARSRYGTTPLMSAAASDQAPMARWLIAAGADTSARDVEGHDAAEIAAEAGYAETAELIQNADDLRLRAQRGRRSLNLSELPSGRSQKRRRSRQRPRPGANPEIKP